MSGMTIEEVEGTISRDHVEERIADWHRRIESLYLRLESWLPTDWSARRARDVAMAEEMMRRFEVPEHRLPVLELLRSGTPAATIEPRGLWIIGANGRLDLVCDGSRFLIVDQAEPLHEPDWRIAPFEDRGNITPLDEIVFRKALAA